MRGRSGRGSLPALAEGVAAATDPAAGAAEPATTSPREGPSGGARNRRAATITASAARPPAPARPNP
ncbi:hypothetical protein KBZ21_26605, partial [Streptomyces sp. A73]|nr:hypothetical protein [Streptomyces sp. A73]